MSRPIALARRSLWRLQIVTNSNPVENSTGKSLAFGAARSTDFTSAANRPLTPQPPPQQSKSLLKYHRGEDRSAREA